MFGARNSLLIGFMAITFGLFFGTIFGMMSGYYRGWADRVIEVMTNILLAFPALLLAIFIVRSVTAQTARRRRPTPDRSPIFSLSILAILAVDAPRGSTRPCTPAEFVIAAAASAPNRESCPRDPPNIVPTLLSFAHWSGVVTVAEGARRLGLPSRRLSHMGPDDSR
jgi:ABC-type dipeptide/oligopeptide/nickel transport system permease subunit